MKLSAPTQGVFIVSVVLVIFGALGFFDIVPQLGAYSFWMVFIGYLVLLVANMTKGL